jgi:AcrR family transcriptional regulator
VTRNQKVAHIAAFERCGAPFRAVFAPESPLREALFADNLGEIAMAEEPSTPVPAARVSDRSSRRPSGFVTRKRRGPGSYDRRLSPEARREEQRRTLVDAAAHVFARDGFANASVASILEASGLSRGTFYRHFKDLREAFFAVQLAAADVLIERVATAFSSESEPFDKTRAAIAAYLGLVAERGDLARVFHREALVSGKEYGDLRRDRLARIQSLFREGLALSVEKGILSRMPEDLTIYAVIIGIEGVAVRYLEERREHEIQEALEPLLRLCGRAFSSS